MVMLSVVGLAMLHSPALIADRLGTRSLHHAIAGVTQSWLKMLSDWRYWSFLALLAVLERAHPARRGEGLFSVGAAQDLVWLVAGPVFLNTFVHAYYLMLDGAYRPLLDGVSIDLQPVLGTAGVAAFAFVVGDFLNWLSHIIRHKVSALWHFHEVHHSQTSMSPLLDQRVHFVEHAVTATIFFLPATLLSLPSQTISVLATATILYTGFFHANIRTNLGPLRYVLVTPQSHRVHHSSRPEHSDTNFGTIFCLWDRLFGLQYHDDNEYPPVGVTNERFPLERSARPLALLTTCARQLLHPFASLLRDLRGGSARRD